ncbi:MAG TPA: CPXCG motif-containing cysteine-rich protein, partial [Myxococcaceae bacterium]|nr:CPXCG motif-containing cysteine-rich protein [Myxococcaceae bacterium]
RLEGLPSRVAQVEVDTLESTVLELQELLAQREPAPGAVQLAMEGDPGPAPADRVALGVACPYCGEQVAVHAEPTGMSIEQYVEDCPVCCRPWLVHLERSSSGVALRLAREDD